MVRSLNKFCVAATIIIIGGLLIGTTFYKVQNIHNNKVLLVEKKEIIEAAKKCFNEKNPLEQRWYYYEILKNMEELKEYVAYKEYKRQPSLSIATSFVVVEPASIPIKQSPL